MNRCARSVWGCQQPLGSGGAGGAGGTSCLSAIPLPAVPLPAVPPSAVPTWLSFRYCSSSWRVWGEATSVTSSSTSCQGRPAGARGGVQLRRLGAACRRFSSPGVGAAGVQAHSIWPFRRKARGMQQRDAQGRQPWAPCCACHHHRPCTPTPTPLPPAAPPLATHPGC